MRAVVVVQARLGSSRLPGKSLALLGGRPLIAHVLSRAEAAGVGRVILATSDNERDEALVAEASRMGVPSLAIGPEWDVLYRYAKVAEALVDVDTVVRVTGDCPFLAPEVVRLVVDAYATGGDWQRGVACDYASNDTTRTGYPDGTDVEVFSRHALELACASATDKADREHVTPWMRRNLATRTVYAGKGIGRWSWPTDVPVPKLSVDSPDDLAFARSLYGYLAPGRYDLDATLAAAKAAIRAKEN